ncbi:hypothetical protein NBRC116601_15500 [Cognatishimia sp. WU-CL00825]|uniref:hypothetical protein n=1 Tax=Cognatishimia sp. WU-CL00825 TaxID=3127658 RepID=UPI003107E221
MKRKWMFGLGLYALLLGGGFWLGQSLSHSVQLSAGQGSIWSPMVLAVAAIYLLTSALPFVPGAEIGLGLMMVFGVRVALVVYGCMVIALWLAFGVGRLVPQRHLLGLFSALHMVRAADLVRQTTVLSPKERSDFLLARLPGRVAPYLLNNRYLALIVVLNLPGNAIIGGGGGIALVAGLSRLFSVGGYMLATALAVAPIPVLVMLLGYRPL